MIWSLLSEAWPILLAVAAFLGWGVYQRKDGAAKERAKADAKRLQSITTKKEIRDEVENLDPASLDARFERWRLPDDTKR